jgi:hypothetical protein
MGKTQETIKSTKKKWMKNLALLGYIDRKSRARLNSKNLRYSIQSKEEEKLNENPLNYKKNFI